MALKIGRYIMSSRQDVNVDPDDLATRLNIKRDMLNNWELDVSHPNMDAVLAIAHVLGIDVRMLIGMKATRGRDWRHPFAKKDAIQWARQGSERRQQALAIVLQMARDLDPANTDVHDVLANYYESLIQERDTRTDMVINGQNVKLGNAMSASQNISESDRSYYEQLMKLAMEALTGK